MKRPDKNYTDILRNALLKYTSGKCECPLDAIYAISTSKLDGLRAMSVLDDYVPPEYPDFRRMWDSRKHTGKDYAELIGRAIACRDRQATVTASSLDSADVVKS